MPPEPGAAHPAVHSHRGTRAIQRMVEYAPSTGSLALWMEHRDTGPAEGDAVAANDGRHIYYGPAFDALSLPRQTGLVAHEVLHVALRHVPRYHELRRQIGDVDLELFNICADAIVNSTLAHLGWLELERGAVMLEGLLAQALDIREGAAKALLEWDLERLYRAVDDRAAASRQRKERSGGQRSERGKTVTDAADGETEVIAAEARPDGPRASRARALGRHSPRDLVPAEDAPRPEAEAEQAREWRERILRGHAGDGIHSMLRELLADLPKVRTPWEQILRTQLARGLSLRPDRSWSRPARSYIANQGRMAGGRRMPWEPGFSSAKAVARLAVLVDVSGSIDDPLLQRFAREIAAITRRMEAKVVVIIGDDKVRRVERFEPGRAKLEGVQFTGGGGTDFTPLLEEAERWRPDIAVFLTDLEGPADYRPSFEVLWAVTADHADMPHPFGRRLVLE
jgi:predicted metal-dependent peptidase